MTDDITMKDVSYWRQMTSSSADSVLSNFPQAQEIHKSQFRNLAIDLSERIPTAFARTPSQKRFDLSIAGCDFLKIDMFAGHLEWLKESGERENMSYQIGYTRDVNADKAILRYIAVEFNGRKIEDYVF